MELGTILDEASEKFASLQTDSGLQLESGNRVKRRSAEVQPLGLSQPGRRCVETSGDVIRVVYGFREYLSSHPQSITNTYVIFSASNKQPLRTIGTRFPSSSRIDKHSRDLGDVASFPLRYRVISQRKKCCQQIIGLDDESFSVRFGPEIIVEGETGFIVEDIDRAVEAVGKIEQISRARCRREFEQRFTDRHMAEDYIRIYQQLLSRSSTQAAA